MISRHDIEAFLEFEAQTKRVKVPDHILEEFNTGRLTYKEVVVTVPKDAELTDEVFREAMQVMAKNEGKPSSPPWTNQEKRKLFS